ncbi:MAG: hypothetical protein Q8M31_19705 [Beijerinckiaceae bacterium]|nr:hypothetical protein [Beijerinckiaceae bacterium]
MKKAFLVVIAIAFVVSPAFAQSSGKVTAAENEGRSIVLDGKTKVAVSATATKVTIDGAAAKREAITVGMLCKVDSSDKPTTMACTSK